MEGGCTPPVSRRDRRGADLLLAILQVTCGGFGMVAFALGGRPDGQASFVAGVHIAAAVAALLLFGGLRTVWHWAHGRRLRARDRHLMTVVLGVWLLVLAIAVVGLPRTEEPRVEDTARQLHRDSSTPAFEVGNVRPGNLDPAEIPVPAGWSRSDDQPSENHVDLAKEGMSAAVTLSLFEGAGMNDATELKAFARGMTENLMSKDDDLRPGEVRTYLSSPHAKIERDFATVYDDVPLRGRAVLWFDNERGRLVGITFFAEPTVAPGYEQEFDELTEAVERQLIRRAE